MSTTIRIGIIGAGRNTCQRHIPELQAIDGVEIVCVANRSLESSRRVAEEFGLPEALEHWRQVIDRDDIDAIVIGTWPYLHCEATVAALESGKHVLCEARMAMNANQAREMLAASQRRPELVAQLVPSPFSLEADPLLHELAGHDFLGDLYELQVRGLTAAGADPELPLTWRQQAKYSGFNVLALGIVVEAMNRHFPPARRLVARAHTFITERLDPETGAHTGVDVPDSVAVLAELVGGAQAVYHFSGVARHAGPLRFEAYGSRGVIHFDFSSGQIRAAGDGDTALMPVEIPADKRGGWRVEADFIDAIRGVKAVELTTFEDGVKYMDFTEAVHRSAATGQWVELPFG